MDIFTITLIISHYIPDARFWCNIWDLHLSFYSFLFSQRKHCHAIHNCVGDGGGGDNVIFGKNNE